jgi:uncharacterized membrane protein
MSELFHSAWRTLVRYFLAGVLAILPLVVTVAVVLWVSNFLTKILGPETWIGRVLREIGVTILPQSTSSYVGGWLVVLLVIIAMGMVFEMGAKTLFARFLERMFGKIPLIGSIYRTSQQVVEMLDTSNKEAIKGMSAVYCFFGSRNGPTILAFLVSSERFRIGERDYFIVMIPTAPVPFGGAMIMVPVDLVEPANLPIDAMMSIYLSMGVTAPDFIARSKPSLEPSFGQKK